MPLLLPAINTAWIEAVTLSRAQYCAKPYTMDCITWWNSFPPFKNSVRVLRHERRDAPPEGSVTSQKQFLSLSSSPNWSRACLRQYEKFPAEKTAFLARSSSRQDPPRRCCAQHRTLREDAARAASLPPGFRNEQRAAAEARPLHLGLVLGLYKGNVKAGEAELPDALIVTHGYLGVVKAAAG